MTPSVNSQVLHIRRQEYTMCGSNRANYLRKKARKEPLFFLDLFNPPLIH